MTLLALPPLFRKLGQSHRSLFGFLAGGEAHGLGRFLGETAWDGARPPVFAPDALFDYAGDALQGGWSSAASGQGRAWAEAVETVERANYLSPLARRALKAVGLLGLLRDPRLAASPAVLRLALSAPGSEVTETAFGAALDELADRKLVVYSRGRDAYRIWEGGDVDVAGALEARLSALPADVTLNVATRLCPPPRLVARRHSYERGTTRTFAVLPCEAPALASTLTKAGWQLSVILCLARTQNEEKQAAEVAHAQTAGAAHLLVAVAPETDALRDAARTVAALERVEKETPALQGDRAARREVAARRDEAEAAFRAEWDRLFGHAGVTGPGQNGASEDTRWFAGGAPVSFDGPRDFAQFLSRLADQTFPAAPVLRNELINRDALSSQAAAGRRTLIEALLARAGEERLGLAGFPPEVSMYECVLRATGLHRREENGRGWTLAAPDPAGDPANLLGCWQALEEAVFAHPPAPRPLPDLFARLAAPPFGLTQGVLPVLLCAFLMVRRNETTLYREGTFLAEPSIADWEVLLRRPELFAVAGCRVEGERAVIVERIGRGLGVRPLVVPVVRALLAQVRKFPEHAWKTRRLPDEVLAVRTAFERARSPEQLLFDDLPRALGLTLLAGETVGGEAADVERFFHALNGALRVWGRATPQVIEAARDALLVACGLPAGEGGWDALRSRASDLEGTIAHPTLEPFVSRLAERGEERANQTSVLALVASRPPRTWTDADVDRFGAQARVLGGLFQQAVQNARDFRAADLTLPPLTPEEETRSQEIATNLRAQLQCDFADEEPGVLYAALSALLRELSVQDDKEKVAH